MRQGFPFSPVLFYIVLEVPTSTFVQGGEVGREGLEEEEAKLISVAGYTIIHVENAKVSARSLLEL